MTRRKILLIQSTETQGNGTKQHLEEIGYKVLWAGSGLTALMMARNVVIDLIVLDVALPDIEGLDLCRRFRQQRDTQAIPIILLVARGYIREKKPGKSSGPDDFLEKPYSEQELSDRIAEVLKTRLAVTGLEPGSLPERKQNSPDEQNSMMMQTALRQESRNALITITPEARQLEMIAITHEDPMTEAVAELRAQPQSAAVEQTNPELDLQAILEHLPELIPLAEPIGQPHQIEQPFMIAHPELLAKPEAVKPPLMTANPEPIAKPELATQPGIVAHRELTAKPETIKRPLLTASPEAIAKPEAIEQPVMTAQPAPIVKPEPIIQPMMAAQKEPAAESKPTAQSKSMEQPTPIAQPTSLSQPANIAQPTQEEPVPVPDNQPPLLAFKVTGDSVVDSATGLFGRPQFEAMFTKEFKRSNRFKQQPLSCMLIDLDGQKRGRHAQESLIKAIIGQVQKTIREVDTAAWWNGESLIVMLPNTLRTDALQAAARILESVAMHSQDWPDAMDVTMSIGVAGLPDESIDSEQKMIEAAEAARKRAQDLMSPSPDHAKFLKPRT